MSTPMPGQGTATLGQLPASGFSPDPSAAVPVRFETRDLPSGLCLGIATLDRPRQLNALNLEMCARMLDQFRQWASDEQVVAVLLSGAGDKGFCGGGDVAEIIRQVRAGGPARFVYGDRFFDVEYELDRLVHRYPKPFIIYSHGVCMGGGVGLMAGASHRIVSDQTRMAMPEIHIGLYPDVGAGWFLNRVPGGIGRVLGMTGLVINEADALFAGLADHFWPLEEHNRLLDGLMHIEWEADTRLNHERLSQWLLLNSRRYGAGLPSSNLRQYFDALRYISAMPSAAAIRDALQAAALEDPWFSAPAESLAKGSSVSAVLIHEYLNRTKRLSIEQVLGLDALIARQCQRAHDFPEGVRALLIDKDRNPRWQFGRIEDVDPELVAAHFR